MGLVALCVPAYASAPLASRQSPHKFLISGSCSRQLCGSAVATHLVILNSSIRLSAVGFNVLCINPVLNYTNHPPSNEKQDQCIICALCKGWSVMSAVIQNSHSSVVLLHQADVIGASLLDKQEGRKR